MNNKALIKVAGILGIIFGLLTALAILKLNVISLIIGLAMIACGFKLNDLSNQTDQQIKKQKDTILFLGIFFIIFSLIPGILTIIYYIGINKNE